VKIFTDPHGRWLKIFVMSALSHTLPSMELILMPALTTRGDSLCQLRRPFHNLSICERVEHPAARPVLAIQQT
jgi:hypothetical protein